MANKKFSDFVLGTAVSDIDYVVGYKGLDNIQIAPAQLDSTYELNFLSIGNGVELALEGYKWSRYRKRIYCRYYWRKQY